MRTRLFPAMFVLGSFSIALSGCYSPYGGPVRPMGGPMVSPTGGAVYGTPTGAPVAMIPAQTAMLGEPIPQYNSAAVVQLPSNAAASYHRVTEGESLSGIAQRYGLSADQLRTANGLDADATVKGGQLLSVPRGSVIR